MPQLKIDQDFSPTQCRKRLLLVAPHGSYRTAPFIEVAKAHNIDLLIASEGKYSLVDAYADGLHVDLKHSQKALDIICRVAHSKPFDGVIATDDSTTELTSMVAKQLHLPYNQPDAVHFTRRKDLARERLAAANIQVPRFQTIDLDKSLDPQFKEVIYPCVVKPLAMSASRGVIRADDQQQLYQAVQRIEKILTEDQDSYVSRRLLVEGFIPGFEIAMEGMLNDGELQILAVFDKPDPLDGPYFEETYYVTPTRLSSAVQRNLRETVFNACRAFGLHHGPIHAECRVNSEGIWILEVAARTIGGLCSRLFQFGVGSSLEELVLYQAIGKPIKAVICEEALGVLMIPIPKRGVLRRVEGLSAAGNIRYIEEVIIQIREGYELVPLPEGSSYLGFIFCRAPDTAVAEKALRLAHQQLNIVVGPMWKGVAENIVCH